MRPQGLEVPGHLSIGGRRILSLRLHDKIPIIAAFAIIIDSRRNRVITEAMGKRRHGAGEERVSQHGSSTKYEWQGG